MTDSSCVRPLHNDIDQGQLPVTKVLINHDGGGKDISSHLRGHGQRSAPKNHESRNSQATTYCSLPTTYIKHSKCARQFQTSPAAQQRHLTMRSCSEEPRSDRSTRLMSPPHSPVTTQIIKATKYHDNTGIPVSRATIPVTQTPNKYTNS